ncbi:MAG TPA: FixH family protein [Nitrospirota bacterium]|nr:FixH family protein [Nitrospirota bacterium]
MKKSMMLFIIAALAMFTAAGCTKGYQAQKTAGDLTVTLSAGSYPLIIGDNAMTIKITDASGKAVSDAKVGVRYYMSAMPGMAPMEYNVEAAPQGGGYGFTATIAMEGGWRVDVNVVRGDKPSPTMTFNVDAR